MSKFYQKISLSMASVLVISLLAGCQETPNDASSVATTEGNVQAINSIEPSATSAQIIGIYRPIFIANLARAEEGIQRLASQQANTQLSNKILNQVTKTIPSIASTPNTVASTTINKEVDMPVSSQENLQSRNASVVAASTLESLPTQLSPMATTIESDKAGIRYDTAMQALYRESPLSVEVYDTLLDIAVFTPDVFTDSEINHRLQYHSPALARMVNQHQVWRQLEINRQKQSVQLQKEQEAKFNKQLEAFNKTLAEYDRIIADYQVRLIESDKKIPKNKTKAPEATRYEKKKQRN